MTYSKTREAWLRAGESADIVFPYVPKEPGIHNVAINGMNGTFQALEVLPEPAIEISNFQWLDPQPFLAGSTVYCKYIVTNPTTRKIKYRIEIRIHDKGGTHIAGVPALSSVELTTTIKVLDRAGTWDVYMMVFEYGAPEAFHIEYFTPVTVVSEAPPVVAGEIDQFQCYYQGLANWSVFQTGTTFPSNIPIHFGVGWWNTGNRPMVGHIDLTIDGMLVISEPEQDMEANAGDGWTAIFKPITLASGTYTLKAQLLAPDSSILDEKSLTVFVT